MLFPAIILSAKLAVFSERQALRIITGDAGGDLTTPGGIGI
jgi:hypothetical protein